MINRIESIPGIAHRRLNMASNMLMASFMQIRLRVTNRRAPCVEHCDAAMSVYKDGDDNPSTPAPSISVIIFLIQSQFKFFKLSQVLKFQNWNDLKIRLIDWSNWSFKMKLAFEMKLIKQIIKKCMYIYIYNIC